MASYSSTMIILLIINYKQGDNMTLTKEQLDVKLEKFKKDIQKLTDNLIKALTDVGIEYIDLYNLY